MTTLFIKKVFIPFHLCDPAGVLFFGTLFSFAHQIYEHFVVDRLQIEWNDWFQNRDWVVPIKHTEADYQAPLLAGQWYDVEMELTKVGESSFAFDFRFYKDKVQHCGLKTVHVFCDRNTRTKIPIPDAVRTKLTK